MTVILLTCLLNNSVLSVCNTCMGKLCGGEFSNLLYFLHIPWLKFEFWICCLFHVLWFLETLDLMTSPTHSALQLWSHSLVMKNLFVYLLSFEPCILRICIFRVSKWKFLRAGGLAKLSVLTQLIGCGFVEDSRLGFFLCCFHLPLCDQDQSVVWLQCSPVGAQDFLFADICFS